MSLSPQPVRRCRCSFCTHESRYCSCTYGHSLSILWKVNRSQLITHPLEHDRTSELSRIAAAISKLRCRVFSWMRVWRQRSSWTVHSESIQTPQLFAFPNVEKGKGSGILFPTRKIKQVCMFECKCVYMHVYTHTNTCASFLLKANWYILYTHRQPVL